MELTRNGSVGWDDSEEVHGDPKLVVEDGADGRNDE